MILYSLLKIRILRTEPTEPGPGTVRLVIRVPWPALAQTVGRCSVNFTRTTLYLEVYGQRSVHFSEYFSACVTILATDGCGPV